MREELQKKLYEKYPKIFCQKELPMTVTAMCWGIACDDGWYNILDALCANIQAYVNNTKTIQVEATQVKEKYGSLRFYTNFSNDYVDALVDMAESMSSRTCETCGNAGTPNEDGWVKTLCQPCRKEYDSVRSAKWGINQKLAT